MVSSALLEVELARAVIRARSQFKAVVTDTALQAVVDAIDLIDLDARQLKPAAGYADAYLRALDAIHLAAALTVHDRLQAMLTYDVRMIQAAQARSPAVVAPN